ISDFHTPAVSASTPRSVIIPAAAISLYSTRTVCPGRQPAALTDRIMTEGEPCRNPPAKEGASVDQNVQGKDLAWIVG
nr:hypothetical protein [Clostridiales bacterium]